MDNIFMDKVIAHHNFVKEKFAERGYSILMTSAIGSQNYGLETDTSDCDTFTLILPDFSSFIRGTIVNTQEFDVEDGKCVVKDLRSAFKNLRRPTPNSTEIFLSRYQYWTAPYDHILGEYLHYESNLFYLTHSDYNSMYRAVVGTIQGLHGRNMTVGKKLSHAIRLSDFFYHYVYNDIFPSYYLRLKDVVLDRAQFAKNFGDDVSQTRCEKIEKSLLRSIEKIKEENDFTQEPFATTERVSKDIIDNFQAKLMDVYFKENGYVKAKN